MISSISLLHRTDGRNNPAVIFIAIGSLEQWVNKDARPKLVSIQGE